jgi:hypothetical protein
MKISTISADLQAFHNIVPNTLPIADEKAD